MGGTTILFLSVTPLIVRGWNKATSVSPIAFPEIIIKNQKLKIK